MRIFNLFCMYNTLPYKRMRGLREIELILLAVTILTMQRDVQLQLLLLGRVGRDCEILGNDLVSMLLSLSLEVRFRSWRKPKDDEAEQFKGNPPKLRPKRRAVSEKQVIPKETKRFEVDSHSCLRKAQTDYFNKDNYKNVNLEISVSAFSTETNLQFHFCNSKTSCSKTSYPVKNINGKFTKNKKNCSDGTANLDYRNHGNHERYYCVNY